jgi:hypothetical protein
MDMRAVRSRIAIFRRHFNLQAEDILACYDTAIVAMHGPHDIKYITVSISPSNFKLVKAQAGEEAVTKHPGSGVECVLLFKDLYVRAEARVPDQDVVWSSNLGIYTPITIALIDMMQRVVMAPKSTKRQIEHAKRVIAGATLKAGNRLEKAS